MDLETTHQFRNVVAEQIINPLVQRMVDDDPQQWSVQWLKKTTAAWTPAEKMRLLGCIHWISNVGDQAFKDEVEQALFGSGE